ncbi:MAG: hydroxyacylglutathione hydrolase [Thermodesulfobacteriota bacterium]|nr:hydroxyacylglutathione hydrolase [Thermodesulfobacteriota bacterium]
MIENVVEGIRWIPGRDKFLPDSHVYVIGEPESHDLSLVDCGLMEMGSYKIEALESGGIDLNHVHRFILTHTHMDHIGCLAELLAVIPHAEVWVHEAEGAFLERGDSRIVFGNKMFESMIRTQYAVDENSFTFKVHRKLTGGEILMLGGVEIEVIHLPGHSCGSIGLYNRANKLLMSGDTIYADGAIGRYDLYSADSGELKRSLEFLSKLDLDILLPCHNRIVRSGAKPMVENTVRQWSPILGD